MLELADDVVDLGNMTLIDLRLARNPRLYDVAVEGDFPGVPYRQYFGLRQRADPAHLALQDVLDLR
jgi:hypothetical protein